MDNYTTINDMRCVSVGCEISMWSGAVISDRTRGMSENSRKLIANFSRSCFSEQYPMKHSPDCFSPCRLLVTVPYEAAYKSPDC